MKIFLRNKNSNYKFFWVFFVKKINYQIVINFNEILRKIECLNLVLYILF
jgi:hypothetical protein